MLKKIVTKLAIVGIVSLSILPVSVQANPLNNSSKSKDIAIQYLSAVQNKDIDKSIELSKDVFIPNDEDRKDDLKSFLSDPNNNLKSFEVLELKDSKENTDIFNTKLEFLNGKIVEAPIKIENSKVILDTSVDYIKEIKAGEEIPTRSKRSQVATWDVKVGSYDPYGFSSRFSTSASYVTLNYRQTASTQFTIVEKWVIGYDEVSYTAERGPNWDSGPDQVVLNKIPGKSFNKVRLLIRPVTAGRSFGEVYS